MGRFGIEKKLFPIMGHHIVGGIKAGVPWEKACGYILLNFHEYSPRLFRGEHLLCIRDNNDVTCQ